MPNKDDGLVMLFRLLMVILTASVALIGSIAIYEMRRVDTRQGRLEDNQLKIIQSIGEMTGDSNRLDKVQIQIDEVKDRMSDMEKLIIGVRDCKERITAIEGDVGDIKIRFGVGRHFNKDY